MPHADMPNAASRRTFLATSLAAATALAAPSASAKTVRADDGFELEQLIAAERAAYAMEARSAAALERLWSEQRPWENARDWPLISLGGRAIHPIAERATLVNRIQACEQLPVPMFAETRAKAAAARRKLEAIDAELRAQEADMGVTAAQKANDEAFDILMAARDAVLRYPVMSPNEFALKGAWLRERFVEGEEDFCDLDAQLLLQSCLPDEGAAA